MKKIIFIQVMILLGICQMDLSAMEVSENTWSSDVECMSASPRKICYTINLNSDYNPLPSIFGSYEICIDLPAVMRVANESNIKSNVTLEFQEPGSRMKKTVEFKQAIVVPFTYQKVSYEIVLPAGKHKSNNGTITFPDLIIQ